MGAVINGNSTTIKGWSPFWYIIVLIQIYLLPKLLRNCFRGKRFSAIFWVNDHIWISIFSLEQQVLVHWCIWFLRRLNPNRALLEISKQNRKKLKKIFTEIINTRKNHYVIDYVSIRQVVGYITNASRATLFRTNKKILMCPLYCSLKEKWKWLGRITSLLRYHNVSGVRNSNLELKPLHYICQRNLQSNKYGLASSSPLFSVVLYSSQLNC